MPDQNKLRAETDNISDMLETAKSELVSDLLKLKKKVSDEEYITAISKLDIKALLLKKLENAKAKFIAYHKTILEETVPFGEKNNGSK